MLLEFKTKNYKSFKDTIIFKMEPADKIHDLAYSVLNKEVYGKQKNKLNNQKGLCSAVIYGPNSAGKTNLIGAMDVFKAIVLRGHIKNAENENNSPNIARTKLDVIPNINSAADAPVEFSVKFIKTKLLVEYELAINLGAFLDKNTERKIEHEKLTINGKMIFYRTDTLEIGDLKVIDEYLVKGFNQNILVVAQNNLNPVELFLSTMFKSVYSNSIANMIIEWFEKDLSIVYRADAVQFSPSIEAGGNGRLYVDPALNNAMKEFGLTANAFGFSKDENDVKARAVSLISTNNRNIAVNAEDFESFGTMRFMNVFPVILSALQNGQTVVIDEFDASIHPMALMSIVNVFHNDDINVNGSQLIFNTHNPIFLNRNLFRRDEIKFIERNEDTGISSHYSLSDFGTSGPKGVRNTSDYMKNYFVSQYGAIKYVDFSDVFESAVKKPTEASPGKEV